MDRIDYEKYIQRFRTGNELIIETILNEETLKLQYLYELLINKILNDDPNDNKEVINHTRDAMILANQLLEANDEFSQNEKNIVLGAVILHDYFKYQYNESHAEKSKEVLDDSAIKNALVGNEEIVITIIQSHEKNYNTDILDAKTKEMCHVLINADQISKLFKHKNWTHNGKYSNKKNKKIVSKIDKRINGKEAKKLFEEQLKLFYENK